MITPGDANQDGSTSVIVIQSDGTTELAENGTNDQETDTLRVVLGRQPASDVVIDFSSLDTEEFTVSPAQLTFTAANHNQPQTVTLRGVYDGTVDGSQTITARASVVDASSDDEFDSLVDVDTNVTVLDVPNTPANVTPTHGSPNHPGRVVFTWDDVVGETDYYIWMANNPGNGEVPYSNLAVPPDTTSFTIPENEALEDGDYLYFLTAGNADGFAPWAGPIAFSVGQAAPTMPAAPVANVATSTQIEWPAIANATSYNLYLISLDSGHAGRQPDGPAVKLIHDLP